MNNRAMRPIPPGVEAHILTLRGQKVLLSQDLGALYGVPAGALIQAVKRNRTRFPRDFLFQLTPEELKLLKSQSVISSWGGIRRAMPYAFTQEGVAMLSSVLRSSRAVAVNVEIMRAFVRLRRLALSVDDLAKKVAALERTYDERFRIVFTAIKELMAPPTPPPRRRIGFARTD